MNQPFDIPIALIVFRRPDVTRQLLRILAQLRPTRLFVIADGPRPDRPDEFEACHKTRGLFDHIDWDCHVERLFAQENYGCRDGPLRGINWVFERVDRAIILEDDCQPDPTFFRFAAELLTRFENDKRVTMISGNNYLPRSARAPHSYYFSRLGHTWGWATWRRAWQFYDVKMEDWPSFRDSDRMRDIFPIRLDRVFWRKCFDSVYEGDLADAWDFQWTFSQLLRGGLSVVPSCNLVTNVGGGELATHTSAANSGVQHPVHPMTFPLLHPDQVAPNHALEIAEARQMVRMRDPRPGFLRHLPHTGIVSAMQRLFEKGRNPR